MAKKKDEIIWVESSEVTCPGWMLTFGDAMSLLLCFFVLMLTFSTRDDAKLMDVMGLVKGAMSPVEAPQRPSDAEVSAETAGGGVSEEGEHRQQRVDPTKASPVTLRTLEFTEKRMELDRELKAIGFSKFVSLSLLDEGVSLRVELDTLFEPGSTRVRRAGLEMLQGFAVLCSGAGNEVRLTGKIPTSYISNMGRFSKEWALVMGRLGRLGDILVTSFNIERHRLSYGMAVVEGEDEAVIELLLVEKTGIKEVAQDDLTKELMEFLKKGKK